MARLRTVGAGTLLGAVVLVGLPAGAWAQPVTDYQMPFPCGQEWKGTTRSGHSPSPRSIDWNRADDDGDPVVASAPGVVTTAEASSNKGYGHHVVLDHGDGVHTFIADELNGVRLADLLAIMKGGEHGDGRGLLPAVLFSDCHPVLIQESGARRPPQPAVAVAPGQDD